MQPFRKRPFQIIQKPTKFTYKIIDANKKNQHRNNFVPYYPKEYFLRELTQLFSFTSLNIVAKPTEINKNTRKFPINYHSHPIHIKRQPSKKITKNTTNPENQIPQKQRNNCKLEEKKSLPETEKNHNNANHCVLQINQEKITKFLSHNLSYQAE